MTGRARVAECLIYLIYVNRRLNFGSNPNGAARA